MNSIFGEIRYKYIEIRGEEMGAVKCMKMRQN